MGILNQKEELVSIIMPVYNGGQTLEAAITSVLSQTYKQWELIIIDDHSSDHSLDIINKFTCENDRIICIKTENHRSGAAIARNKGIKESKGRYIAFLDSDDCWTEDKLELQLKYMNLNNANFIYSSYAVFKGNTDNIVGIFKPKMSLNYKQLLYGCDIGCLTVMYDTSFFGKMYFSNINKEDYALWLDMSKQPEAKFYGINKVLAYYRLSFSSTSGNKLSEILKQYKVYRVNEKLDISASLFYLVCYSINGINKHFFKYRNKRES